MSLRLGHLPPHIVSDVRLVFGNSGDTGHTFHIQVISESSPALP